MRFSVNRLPRSSRANGDRLRIFLDHKQQGELERRTGNGRLVEDSFPVHVDGHYV